MNVEQIMTRCVATCHPEDSLDVAAERMWSHDCGAVPVVDADQHIVGMITDRDIAMAAYTQGRRLPDVPVTTAMAHDVIFCRHDDSIQTASVAMGLAKVRRLPVVDGDHQLVGIVSLNDLAREAAHERGLRKPEVPADVVLETLAAVSEPRTPEAGAPHGV